MTLDEFCLLLRTTLEIEEALTPSTRLADLSKYDSMGQVSVRALADEHFDRIITGSQLNRCQTVSDLYVLLTEPAA